MNDSLGDRIKRYERASEHGLMPNVPVLIRIDGRAFHTFTRGLERPFSSLVIETMVKAAQATARQMSGFKLGYVQSDEATFLLTDYDTHETQPWFDYNLKKVISISASAFTAYFNRYWDVQFSPNPQDENFLSEQKPPAMFDSRAFNVPDWDAPNVFIWRQQDWERNSVQMFARAYLSHKECQGKNILELKALLRGLHHQEWDALSDQLKYGTWILPDGSLMHDKKNYDGIKHHTYVTIP